MMNMSGAMQGLLLQVPPQQEYWKNMLWFGGFVLAGLAGLLIVRYFLNARAARESRNDGSFTLEDLRLMRDRGELTADEYETLKKRVIATRLVMQPKGKEPRSGADESRRQ